MIHGLKKALKRVRSIGTFYVAEPTSEHLEAIRLFELEAVLGFLSPGSKVLEIGAGTGWQAQALHDKGHDVTAIDIPSSNLRGSRIWPVIEYDGETIPARDNSYDFVFSSNVLEHIPHIYEFQTEMQRVLKPDGIAIHVVPSGSWRFWSNVTEVLRTWRIPLVHGEIAENCFVEMYYFGRKWWSRLFENAGWTIQAKKSIRIFYTGSSIMDSRLSIDTRRTLSVVLGGSCHIFVLKNANE